MTHTHSVKLCLTRDARERRHRPAKLQIAPPDARRGSKQITIRRIAKGRQPLRPLSSLEQAQPKYDWVMSLVTPVSASCLRRCKSSKIQEENGCPARIRTSIDGIRIRSLTIRRQGNAVRWSGPLMPCYQPVKRKMTGHCAPMRQSSLSAIAPEAARR